MFTRAWQFIGVVVMGLGLLLGVVTVVSQAAATEGGGITAVTEGSISGIAMYYGTIGGVHDILVAAHPNPSQPPVKSVHINSPGGLYALAGLSDGTYYISAFLDANDSGDGPPDAGEPEAWYDADGDGTPDPVVISGGAMTDIDIYLGDVVHVARSGSVDQAHCGISGNTPCYSIAYAVQSVAATGNIVVVHAGTYTETVSMKAGVDVVSQAGPIVTIMDGEELRGPMVLASGSAISPTVALTGFTITGGYADPTGGGISVENGAQLLVSNTHIISNSARVLGGGIALADNDSMLQLENCLVDGNDKSAMWMNGGTAVIHNSTFSNNHSEFRGGGLLAEKGELTVSDVLFQENQAGLGGGIYASNTAITVTNSQFYSNTVTGGGGGIRVGEGSQFDINSSEFLFNSTDTGAGGIEINTGSTASTGQIRQNLVQSNRSLAGLGGGIKVAGNEVSIPVVGIIGNQILENEATAGGGIYISMGIVDILQNGIEDNVGGIDMRMASGLLENNMIVHSNIDSGSAQVRIQEGSDVTLRHNTLVGLGDGQGVQVRDGAKADIANNIIAGHATGIAAQGVTTATLRHNLFWQNSSADYDGLAVGVGDLARDPGFVDAAASDYHLGICSWAVDTGSNDAGAAKDYDGDARPVNGDAEEPAVVDIGADERITVTAPMPLAGFSVITAGLSVQLTNNSADAVGYEWDFGDGTPVSTELNPSHTFADEGSYTIVLTATGGYACQNVYQTEVTVEKYKVYLPMITR